MHFVVHRSLVALLLLGAGTTIGALGGCAHAEAARKPLEEEPLGLSDAPNNGPAPETPSAAPKTGAQTAGPRQLPPPDPVAKGTKVFVYGPTRCPSCDDAVRFVQSRGVAAARRDVERDRSAATELAAKLDAASLPRAKSYPVIDVAGRIFLYYHRPQLEAALATPGL